MKETIELLLQYEDVKNKEFMQKLTPTLPIDYFIGVKVPNIRLVAKAIKGTELEDKFLNELPHEKYEENMLHTILVSEIKDYDKALKEVIKFLPYVDNWASSDTLHPKCFNKHQNDLLKYIFEWIKSSHTYTVRFGIDCLMTYYLYDYFKEEYLDIVGSIKSEEYYINMMIAWYFSEALTKQYPIAIKYIESKKLDKWVQNKAIQKACESNRIADDVKTYLKTLKK